MSRFSKTIRLRDGTAVLIRAARADDRERLVTAFQGRDDRLVAYRVVHHQQRAQLVEGARVLRAADQRVILQHALDDARVQDLYLAMLIMDEIVERLRSRYGDRLGRPAG